MRKLQSIQALRAIAAWAVVLGHTGTQAPFVLGVADKLSISIYRASQSFVHAGVDLFFVISGFIIFTVTREPRQSDRFREFADFATKRILRIYPLYWVTFFFTILPQQTVRWEDWRIWSWQLTLFDIPANHGVAWSLVFELRFYALAALVLLFFRGRILYGYTVLSAWIVAACSFAFFGGIPTSFFTSPYLIEFVMGVVVAVLTSFKTSAFAKTSIVLGAIWIACSISFLFQSSQADFLGSQFAGAHFTISMETFRIFGFGIPAAMIVYGMVALEQQGSVNVPRALSATGDASYSIYLWHTFILTVLAVHFPFRGLAALIAFYPTTIGIVALVGWASHRWIERPLIRLAHSVPWSASAASRVAVAG